MPKTGRTEHIVICTQERSETQLHIAKVSQSAKALGFSQFLCDVACMERLHFPIAFRGIDGIRSTQPTMRYF